MEGNTNKCNRKLTVLSARNFDYRTKVPCITLSGKWLKTYGFEPGDKIEVSREEDGSVRIRKANQAEEKKAPAKIDDKTNQFHDRSSENPPAEGCYLVVVKEDHHIVYPESELDSLIDIPEATFSTIAEWDGGEWQHIFYDCDVSSPLETETLHVLRWADRRYQ